MLESIAGSTSNFMGDAVTSAVQAVLHATVYKLLYYIACGLLKIVSCFDSMFSVMAGLTPVMYDGRGEYLMDVFFSNNAISGTYWGMALIGIVIAFVCAILAVLRKTFDLNEREKRSHGAIVSSLVQSILIIVSLSFLVTLVINATNLLMQQIDYVFVHGEDLSKEQSITFTEEELAAMARVLNTVGNYSLNPSYDNRYNLNACFNDIRTDLQYLEKQGVFEFYYTTTDVAGRTIATWQSALQQIANAASLTEDLKLDVYNEGVSRALLNAMNLMQVNGSFKPLEEYERSYSSSRKSVPLDRLIFLMSTMHAARNDDYNDESGSITDNLRGAYYHGEKSIYDLDTVNQDFDIGIGATDYIILFLAAWKLLWSLATIILNCVARIFNILMLYLIAPPVIGVSPLDDGAKFKQWTTAFVVQSFSVFGTVVSMRLILIFLPIITDNNLLIFDNQLANLVAKLIIILAAFEVCEKSTSLITGILADNAGWQAITAGDMSQTANKAMDTGVAYGKAYGGKALGYGGTAAKYTLLGGAAVGAGAALGVGYLGYGVGKGVQKGGSYLSEKIGNAWNEHKQRQAEAAQAVAGENGGAGGAGGSSDSGLPGSMGGSSDSGLPGSMGGDNKPGDGPGGGPGGGPGLGGDLGGGGGLGGDLGGGDNNAPLPQNMGDGDNQNGGNDGGGHLPDNMNNQGNGDGGNLNAGAKNGNVGNVPSAPEYKGPRYNPDRGDFVPNAPEFAGPRASAGGFVNPDGTKVPAYQPPPPKPKQPPKSVAKAGNGGGNGGGGGNAVLPGNMGGGRPRSQSFHAGNRNNPPGGLGGQGGQGGQGARRGSFYQGGGGAPGVPPRAGGGANPNPIPNPIPNPNPNPMGIPGFQNPGNNPPPKRDE